MINKNQVGKSGQNLLVVISGPSGAGKDTVIRELLRKNPDFGRIVTTTTRQPRECEQMNQDYHYVSDDQFNQLIQQNKLFEWIEYRGHRYGTQKQDLQRALSSKPITIWRINVRGAAELKAKVKSQYPASVFIFIDTQDLETLKTRLVSRKSETESEMNWNLAKAKWEEEQADRFDFVVNNEQGELDKTVAKITELITKYFRTAKLGKTPANAHLSYEG